MKRCLWAVSLLSLFALSTPRNASACDICKVYGIVCSADNCEFVVSCEPRSFGQNGYNDCYTDWGACYSGGGFCMWASLTAPVCKEPVLSFDAKAS